jgi:hypothetical protein
MTLVTSTLGTGGAGAESTRASHPALNAVSSPTTAAASLLEFLVPASVLILPYLLVTVVLYEIFAIAIQLDRLG